jgi:hypothetical protein
MFQAEVLDALQPPEDQHVFERPLRDSHRDFEPDLIEAVRADACGYPFHIQFFGALLWEAVPAPSTLNSPCPPPNSLTLTSRFGSKPPWRGPQHSLSGALLTTHRDSQLTAGFVHRRERNRGEFSVHLSSGFVPRMDATRRAFERICCQICCLIRAGNETELTRPWRTSNSKCDVGPVGFEPTTGGL